MYESKKVPGKKFGSIMAGRHFDENHTDDGMHTEGKDEMHDEKPMVSDEREEMNEGEKEKEQEEKTGEEQHPMVAEHGKAHKVMIHHDHEAGRHTVTSHHSDGHMHTNVHDAAHKAHDEARELADVPPAGKEENKEKDGFGKDHKGQEGAPSEEDGFSMPNLV